MTHTMKKYNCILRCDHPGCTAKLHVIELCDDFSDEGAFFCYMVENAIAEGWRFLEDKPELKTGSKCFCPEHRPADEPEIVNP